MKEERILALDFGIKRIGIAVTDPMNMFAYPLATLSNDSNFFNHFKKIISEYSVAKIILGFPLKEGGGESSIAKEILKFKAELESITGIETELVDERYTSSIAQERIIATVPSKKKRRDKSLIDKNAAAVMLEDFLNSAKK